MDTCEKCGFDYVWPDEWNLRGGYNVREAKCGCAVSHVCEARPVADTEREFWNDVETLFGVKRPARGSNGGT